MRAGLDRLPQPDPLVVAGDVLDLVRDRAAVGRAQCRERLGQGCAGHVDAQQVGRHACHSLGSQAERLGIEGRVADRLAAERIETRGMVAK